MALYRHPLPVIHASEDHRDVKNIIRETKWGNTTRIEHKAENDFSVYASPDVTVGTKVFQFVWKNITGSGATFTIKQTLDGVNWADIDGTATYNQSGANGSLIVTLQGFKPVAFRVDYAKGSVSAGEIMIYSH